MKTLHFLNKQIAYIMLFLSSQSGNGFILMVAFMFDLATNALGIQLFFSERLVESLSGLGASKYLAFGLSLAFSAFASSALGLSIMQATLNNARVAGITLSFLSVIISVAGLAHVGIQVQTVSELYTFKNIIRICMILGLGITPPIVYAMNASLIIDKFGAVLKKFNDASIEELNKAFDAQTKELGNLDIEITKADVEKKKSKINRRKPTTPKTETVGDKSYNDLIKELGL